MSAPAPPPLACITCPSCVGGTAHRQFAVLLTDSRQTPADLLSDEPDAVVSFWDYTRQPLWNLLCHNRDPRFRTGPKATKHMAPFVHNELVFSNFVSNAGLFVALMRQSSRRFKSHVVRSIRLASVWHLIDPTQDGQQIEIHVTDKADHRSAWESLLTGESFLSPNEMRRMQKLIDQVMDAVRQQQAVANIQMSPPTTACSNV